ncbi:hypothetical protein H7I87_00020 [Mycobacterium timonense]|uniref:Uncharacterized protein n=1 Tax=Mycobacterium bouchedurhonense TaxID=701041 RepID=A0AAW5SCR6_MYCBC|nr:MULTISPECIES: hypothetical protein [Mycobacterium]MCV6992943.1 hypothetical protein [Mycobacterium bouchedurhonense]MCV6993152.1 hypothetical protein [Mycobacterium timonense]
MQDVLLNVRQTSVASELLEACVLDTEQAQLYLVVPLAVFGAAATLLGRRRRTFWAELLPFVHPDPSRADDPDSAGLAAVMSF